MSDNVVISELGLLESNKIEIYQEGGLDICFFSVLYFQFWRQYCLFGVEKASQFVLKVVIYSLRTHRQAILKELGWESVVMVFSTLFFFFIFLAGLYLCCNNCLTEEQVWRVGEKKRMIYSWKWWAGFGVERKESCRL